MCSQQTEAQTVVTCAMLKTWPRFCVAPTRALSSGRERLESEYLIADVCWLAIGPFSFHQPIANCHTKTSFFFSENLELFLTASCSVITLLVCVCVVRWLAAANHHWRRCQIRVVSSCVSLLHGMVYQPSHRALCTCHRVMWHTSLYILIFLHCITKLFYILFYLESTQASFYYIL